MESKSQKPSKIKVSTNTKVTKNKTKVKSKTNNIKSKQRPEEYGRKLHSLERLTLDMG
jgi:hypothetical protein